MQPTIEMEFEYAFNAWIKDRTLTDETVIALQKCFSCTAGSQIDKAAARYPVAFLNYVDERIRKISN